MMPHKDKQKRSEYQRKYKAEHTEGLREYYRQYQKDNHSKVIKKNQDWKKRHADQVKEGCRKYYAANRERVLTRTRKWAILNRDKVNTKERQRNKENPEKTAARNKKWAQNHPEKAMKNKQKWAAANPDKIRTSHLKRNFGITIVEYQDLLEKQGGVCAICGCTNGGKSFSVDHNHKTGEMRGLLCINCNTGIGRLKDDVNLLQKAILYLVAYNQADTSSP